MASKFADFLKEHKIDGRRVMSSSRAIETLRVEDRKLYLAKKRAKGEESSSDDKKSDLPKPRSGRTVTPRLIASASSGGKISGAAKTRLLRAVNRILEQRKQAAIDLRALF
ncbi:MAG TPA: hypothetical protein VHM70_15760 [Polyangiaceae bacterium]|jgi:hypothetical protein|nr:hypothetical protein [Polyangiaceae bacterium]